MSKFTEGDKCVICGAEWEKGKRFANHHVSYDKDITVILCYTCHALLHGSAKIWKHPFAKYGKDKSPYIFARRVVEMYEKHRPVSDADLEQLKEASRIIKEVGEINTQIQAQCGELEIVMYLDDINAKMPANKED